MLEEEKEVETLKIYMMKYSYLQKKGYKEITLLGQNVNSYLVSERAKNKDLSYKVEKENGEKEEVYSFATLLRLLKFNRGNRKNKVYFPHIQKTLQQM